MQRSIYNFCKRTPHRPRDTQQSGNLRISLAPLYGREPLLRNVSDISYLIQRHALGFPDYTYLMAYRHFYHQGYYGMA